MQDQRTHGYARMPQAPQGQQVSSSALLQKLQNGLARLEADLQSGAFTAVKNRFATEMGDYAVISARHGG